MMCDLLAAFDASAFYAVHGRWIRIVVLAVVGLPVLWSAARAAKRFAARKWTAQHGLILGKAVLYGGLFCLTAMVMRELQFNITAILGAAGLVGIAIGFASQTSLGNLISGIFLVGERHFQVGDVIKIGDTMGIVESIDLLAVKLRGFDNTWIRIPNDTILKGEVTTFTKFPIRRIDFKVGVAYKEDVAKVRAVLRAVADEHPLVMDEPEPLLIFTEFGDSSLNFLLGCWAAKEDFLVVKNEIMDAIKARFDDEGIEIPFPHLTIYAGAETAPFPLALPADARPGSEGQ